MSLSVADAEHVDVLIVGAGISGIGAACHLTQRCPGKRFVILEGREAMGGTWDLFRYPGIRSDSDMHTLGYAFRPWTERKAIADGPLIKRYIEDTARAYGVDQFIRFGHKVTRASWSSEAAQWRVEAVRADGAKVAFTCDFLFMGAGYYRYSAGYTPELPGIDRFGGTVIQPQRWPEGFDYAGKRVIVIGSGATAMTLVPAMAETAAHVVMLQRSPTYVVSRPAIDAIGDWLKTHLPIKLGYSLTRWKNVLLGAYFYRITRKQPEKAREYVLDLARKELPADQIEEHFTPSYNVWDQRVCLVPDGDLFQAIREGRASVVTDHIDAITETGIRLRSGETAPADVIVTATGLELEVLGGIAVEVDGKPFEPGHSWMYKGMMFNDVPNLVNAVGYTNASWTLRVDLTCEYFCRLIEYMDALRYAQVTPRQNDPTLKQTVWSELSSGYVQRALDRFPKQGDKPPWRLDQNYIQDLFALRFGRLDDGVLEFRARPAAAQRPEAAPERVLAAAE